LKRLERFFEVKDHELRFESGGFVWYDSSFAFLSGKPIVVDLRVGFLELKRGEEKNLTEQYSIQRHTDTFFGDIAGIQQVICVGFYLAKANTVLWR